MQPIQIQGECARSDDQGTRLHYLTGGLLWFADDTHSGCTPLPIAAFPLSTPIHIILARS
jgi:hypothetical protein